MIINSNIKNLYYKKQISDNYCRYTVNKIIKTRQTLKDFKVMFERNRYFYQTILKIINQNKENYPNFIRFLLQEYNKELFNLNEIIIFICSNKSLYGYNNAKLYDHLYDLVNKNVSKNFIVVPIGNKTTKLKNILLQKNIQIYDFKLAIDIDDINFDNIRNFVTMVWNLMVNYTCINVKIMYMPSYEEKRNKDPFTNLFPISQNSSLSFNDNSVNNINHNNLITDTLDIENIVKHLSIEYLFYNVYEAILYSLKAEYSHRFDIMKNILNTTTNKIAKIEKMYSKKVKNKEIRNILESLLTCNIR